ncbi:MAG: hypothetical protein NUV70_04470 [Caldiserica bacterium]|nr:hypothetical protein [Caldisericota bacterium]
MKKAGRLAGEAGPPRPGKESPTGAGREGFPFLLFLAALEREALVPEGALSTFGWLVWLEPKEESAGAAT